MDPRIYTPAKSLPPAHGSHNGKIMVPHGPASKDHDVDSCAGDDWRVAESFMSGTLDLRASSVQFRSASLESANAKGYRFPDLQSTCWQKLPQGSTCSPCLTTVHHTPIQSSARVSDRAPMKKRDRSKLLRVPRHTSDEKMSSRFSRVRGITFTWVGVGSLGAVELCGFDPLSCQTAATAAGGGRISGPSAGCGLHDF